MKRHLFLQSVNRISAQRNIITSKCTLRFMWNHEFVVGHRSAQRAVHAVSFVAAKIDTLIRSTPNPDTKSLTHLRVELRSTESEPVVITTYTNESSVITRN